MPPSIWRSQFLLLHINSNAFPILPPKPSQAAEHGAVPPTQHHADLPRSAFLHLHSAPTSPPLQPQHSPEPHQLLTNFGHLQCFDIFSFLLSTFKAFFSLGCSATKQRLPVGAHLYFQHEGFQILFSKSGCSSRPLAVINSMTFHWKERQKGRKQEEDFK